MWELDITEGYGYVTTVDVSESGNTSIDQETFPKTMENQHISLSHTQMRKIVDRYCALTGYYPSAD